MNESESPNPYASPAAASEADTSEIGCSRSGDWMVIHRQVPFPPRYCAFTGEPAIGTQTVVERGFFRHTRLQVGVGKQWKLRQRRRLVAKTLAMLAVPPLIWASAGLANHWRIGGLTAIILLLIVVVLFDRCPLSIRWRGDYVWIGGCHPDFLARFPSS